MAGTEPLPGMVTLRRMRSMLRMPSPKNSMRRSSSKASVMAEAEVKPVYTPAAYERPRTAFSRSRACGSTVLVERTRASARLSSTSA